MLRFGGAFQRQGGKNRRFQRPAFDFRPDRLYECGKDLFLFRLRFAAQRTADQADALHIQRAQVDFGSVARKGGDDDPSAPFVDEGQAFAEHAIAQTVDHDVRGVAAFRLAPQDVGYAFAGSIDDHVRPEVGDRPLFSGVPHARDHPEPEGFRHGDDHARQPARAGVHQQRFAGFGVSFPKQIEIRRGERLRKAGSLFHAQIFRRRHDHARRRGGKLGVTAARKQRAHPVALFPSARGGGRNGADISRNFQPGPVGRACGGRIVSFPL